MAQGHEALMPYTRAMNVRISQAEKVKVMNSTDLYAVMQKILLRDRKIDRGKEHFWVVGLATNNRILYIELVGLGTLREVKVDPMDIFSIALQKRTAQVVLVHNHPSGELQPSKADLDITDRMLQVGFFLHIPVVEHLVISEEGYFSFVDKGLLAVLQDSRRYVIPYKEKERLAAEAKALGEKVGVAKGRKAGLKVGKVEGLKVGELKGREAERLQVALAMQAEGLPAAVIVKVTGLTLAQVKGLGAKAKTTSRKVRR